MLLKKLDSKFLNYLVEKEIAPGDKLPPLNDISSELGISIGKLREELEVARHFGLVSVRPKVGSHRQPYNFTPPVLQSVLFGLATQEATFNQFSKLRRAVEMGCWHEAVILLTDEDKAQLNKIIQQAWQKLRGDTVHVPNGEHRALHLAIFSRLDNPFVQGILAAYWEAYEASELTRFAPLKYWIDVWTFHERIVDALCQNEFEAARQLMIEHFALLRTG